MHVLVILVGIRVRTPGIPGENSPKNFSGNPGVRTLGGIESFDGTLSINSVNSFTPK